MKAHSNKRTARTSPKKLRITNKANGLTSQAGLLPAVKFLQKAGLAGAIQKTLTHKRGDNALYDAFDAVFLTVIAVIGGVRSASAVVTVWADGVLRRLAGWLFIPDNSTLGRLFRTFGQRQISGLETVNHIMRGRIWKKALRSSKSNVTAMPCRIVDCYFCYATTENLTAWETHKCYGQRATCETWIEEAKNQMALSHIKMDDFLGKQRFFSMCNPGLQHNPLDGFVQ